MVRAFTARICLIGAGLLSMISMAGCAAPCGDEIGDICVLVGTGDLGFNHDGLLPEETDLFLPSAARRGPDGRIHIVDFNNQRLRRIGDDGRIEPLVGNGFHAIATTDVPALNTPLENPIDFGFFADGRLVFVSYHDPRVLVISDDGTLRSIAGAGEGVVGVVGNEGDGGPAIDALFMQLDGIAITPDDSIYVSDSLANRVRKIEDGMITTVAGTGDAAFTGDGGPATQAALNWPTALELDAEGNLYIVDTFNHSIRRLATDGTITTIAGTGVEGSAGDHGPATMAQLSQPFGLARDQDGTLYIGDRGNFEIRRVGTDGVIQTIAGTGAQGKIVEGEVTSDALGFTARVALDGDWLLVADQSNSMIRRVKLR